jgi:Leucine-rich repeat (LRR) protein
VKYCQEKKDGKLEFVRFEGEIYYAYRDKFDLTNISITKVIEIKGLEKLTNLRELSLQSNQITGIKGLEQLVNLEILDLAANQITDIEGLERLTNLHVLDLRANKIRNSKVLKKLKSFVKYLDLDDYLYLE